MPNLFTQLEDDWTRRAESTVASTILTRWAHAEPTLARFSTMFAVAEAARGRSGQRPDEWEAIQLALLRLSDDDEDARLTLLFVLRPGLIGVARTYTHQWGEEDTASAVVLLALERIAHHPKNGSVRPGAWIVLGVRNDLMRRRLKEVAAATAFGSRAAMPDSPTEVVSQGPSPSDEVLRLVSEAVETGRVTERGGRLILLHRVFGVPTRDIAAAEGRPPATVRQYRNRAEDAIAEMAVA